MSTMTASLVDLLIERPEAPRDVERVLAELAVGIVRALQAGEIVFDQARRDLFNLDNYQALLARKLDARLVELFQWAMELEDVADLAPAGVKESYERVEQLARSVIAAR